MRRGLQSLTPRDPSLPRASGPAAARGPPGTWKAPLFPTSVCPRAPVLHLSCPLGTPVTCEPSPQLQRADPASSQSHGPSSGCSDGFKAEEVTQARPEAFTAMTVFTESERRRNLPH